MARKKNTDMIDRERYQYKSVRYRDGAGKTRYSSTNGDAVARALIGLDLEAVEKAARANGLGELVQKHKNNDRINSGQRRMLLGNALRARVRNGEPVTINGCEIKKLDQKQPVLSD